MPVMDELADGQMWKQQSSFVFGVELAVSRIFEWLELEVEPEVFVVGVRAILSETEPSALFEPADHPWAAGDRLGCRGRSRRIAARAGPRARFRGGRHARPDAAP